MQLPDLIRNLKIPEDHYILIEYNLYFNKKLGQYNKFSIDDSGDIKNLMFLLDQLKKLDKAMKLYVLAYG